jgi:hypothetical protein
MRYTHFTWRVRSGDGISITKSDLRCEKQKVVSATATLLKVGEERANFEQHCRLVCQHSFDGFNAKY